MDKIKLILPNDIEMEADRGLDLEQLSKILPVTCRYQIIGAKVNNDIKELTYVPEDGDKVAFFDVSSADGKRMYKRTALMVMIRAASEVLPTCKINVKQALSDALYCEISGIGPVSTDHIKLIEDRMWKIVGAGQAITKKTVATTEAISFYNDIGFKDKVSLLKYRRMPETNIYTCDWYSDYFYGFMAPNTSYLKLFRLSLYSPGFILELPSAANPEYLPYHEEEEKLSHVYFEANKWGKIIGISDIASLNSAVEQGRFKELIQMSEASHERRIAEIANEIYKDRERISIVLIAGPSSSGKTTFAKRLGIQLRVKGLNPVAISMDDYFVNRVDCPLDGEGEPDLESIETIDTSLFNDHLFRLIQGETVEIPEFDFVTGTRKPSGHHFKLSLGDVLIIEGIHALNDKLTCTVPKWRKFKIYITALIHMNIDDHSIVPATDVRLIRRIVRDNLYRGSDATFTMSIWHKVKAGEVKNIFPFQDDSDEMFNSATVYELSVLRKRVEFLLEQIDRDNPYYADAKRIRRFLTYITSIDEEGACIPPNSILREFIGGSCF